MDKKIDLNKKIILGANERDKKIVNVLVYMILISLVIVFIISNIYLEGSLLTRIVINFNFSIFTLLIIFNILLYKNQKIEIENSIITEINLFNKREEIGTISESTSFCASTTDVTVLKDNKKYFSFKIHGTSDNREFYNYLKDNYSDSIFIKGSKILEIYMYLCAILIFTWSLLESITVHNIIAGIISAILAFVLLLYGLDEKAKSLQIINNEIIYKRLFAKRKINLADLTKLEYRKNGGTGRYKPIFSTYTIKGFNSTSKCFKVDNITPENLENIKDIAKEHKIKMVKNKA